MIEQSIRQSCFSDESRSHEAVEARPGEIIQLVMCY